MINFINEYFNKNNVLYDESNIVDFYLIEKLNGINELSVKMERKYGFLFIETTGVEENVVIKLEGIVILNVKDDGEFFVPIQFLKDGIIEISGICDKCFIKIYGNKFLHKKQNGFLPLNKMIVLGGNNKQLFSFGDEFSMVDGVVVKQEDVGSFINKQTYIKNGEIGLGKLDFSSGLLFYNSFDNYKTSILVTGDKVSDAIFLQNYTDNCINFIYIKNNKVYFKRYDLLFSSLSEECEVSLNYADELSLVMSSVDSYNSRFFGVSTSKGVSVFLINNNLQVQKVYEANCESFRIFEREDCLTVILFNNYSAKIMEFDVGLFKNGENVLLCKNTNLLTNIIDVLIYNDMYIYTSVGSVKGFINN